MIIDSNGHRHDDDVHKKCATFYLAKLGNYVPKSTQPHFILYYPLHSWPQLTQTSSGKVSKLSRRNVIVLCIKKGERFTKGRENFNVKTNVQLSKCKNVKCNSLHLTFKLSRKNVKFEPELVARTTGRRHDTLPGDVCMPTTVGPRHKTLSPLATKKSYSCFSRYHQNNEHRTAQTFQLGANSAYFLVRAMYGYRVGQKSSSHFRSPQLMDNKNVQRFPTWTGGTHI